MRLEKIKRCFPLQKKMIPIVMILVFFLFGITPGFAITIDLIGYQDGGSSGITSARYNWDELAEMEDVNIDSRITGSNFSIFNVAPGDWNSGVWIWGSPGYMQTTFTTQSDSLFVQFEADSNDGPASFWIDGINVYNLNTQNGGWFAIVFEDLAFTTHTLRVNAMATGYPRDLAIDVMGSGSPQSKPASLPEPATMLLLGVGLFGLAGFRKKFKH